MRTVALAATALLLAATSGCGDRERENLGTMDTVTALPPGTVQETGGNLDVPRSYGFEERQDFANSIRGQLADFDRQIEELASQAKSEGGSVSDRALANIRASRRAVEKNLGRVETATAENWEEIRRGVDGAVEHLAEAVERAYPK
jgi:gas vesicle protein